MKYNRFRRPKERIHSMTEQRAQRDRQRGNALRPKAATPTLSHRTPLEGKDRMGLAGDACSGHIFGCGVRDTPSPVTAPDAIAVHSGMWGGRATDASGRV